jgi:hypothetical protein
MHVNLCASLPPASLLPLFFTFRESRERKERRESKKGQKKDEETSKDKKSVMHKQYILCIWFSSGVERRKICSFWS